MKDFISRLNDKFGEKWFTFQPPEARPVHIIENAIPPLGGTPEATLAICTIRAGASDALVIERYALTLWATIANPMWPGAFPVQLPETYYQGRLRWRPTLDMSQLTHDISSLLGGITYNWGVPTYLPLRHDGFSLLKEYTHPRIIVPPGKQFNLMIGQWDTNAGYTPEPGFPYVPNNMWLIGEVSGYILTVPDYLEVAPATDKKGKEKK